MIKVMQSHHLHSLIIFSICLLISSCESAHRETGFTMQQPLDLRDTDGDGVINSRDICADSPVNGTIDNQGCADWQLEQQHTDFEIDFQFDKDQLQEKYLAVIDQIIELTQQKEEATIILVGDTSPEGSDQYNRDLGERRAQTVIDTLINRGVNRSRILGFVYSDDLMQAVLRKRERRTIVRVQYFDNKHIPGWTIYSTESARMEKRQ